MTTQNPQVKVIDWTAELTHALTEERANQLAEYISETMQAVLPQQCFASLFGDISRAAFAADLRGMIWMLQRTLKEYSYAVSTGIEVCELFWIDAAKRAYELALMRACELAIPKDLEKAWVEVCALYAHYTHTDNSSEVWLYLRDFARRIEILKQKREKVGA